MGATPSVHTQNYSKTSNKSSGVGGMLNRPCSVLLPFQPHARGADRNLGVIKSFAESLTSQRDVTRLRSLFNRTHGPGHEGRASQHRPPVQPAQRWRTWRDTAYRRRTAPNLAVFVDESLESFPAAP